MYILNKLENDKIIYKQIDCEFIVGCLVSAKLLGMFTLENAGQDLVIMYSPTGQEHQGSCY